MTCPMECHCIRAVELPDTTSLYASYVEDFAAVARFYAHAPTTEEVRRLAGEVRLDPALRLGVTEVLRGQNHGFGGDAAVDASLDRLAAGAAAIVTGQQVGLFSGPSYTIYKAATALRLAADLTAAGTPAVAIFWLAAEDHDLAEVNHCYWPTRGEPERLDLASEDNAKGSVGRIPLGQAVTALVERAGGMMEGPARNEVLQALAESYRPGETYSSAFGRLMARIFAGTGLILLDPISAELHRLAAPVYRAAVEQHGELTKELVERSAALEKAGYHAQVKVGGENTLLFVDVDGERTPLRARDGGFALGQRMLSAAEASRFLAETPELFSPNALLRPVVQDSLLPTAAYVGGPAEIAYFAQASVVYGRLLGRMPVIMPRASFTLVEARVARYLRKYGVEMADVFRGQVQLRSKMEQVLLPAELTQRLADGEKALRELLAGLREPITKLDATLAGALETAESKILYQFGNLAGKAAHAVAQRSAVLDTHERELLGSLYPRGELQERSLCFLAALAAQGMGLLEELVRRAATGGAKHQVLYL
jgi:bacillithiol biosynthesis cysteine-adding enzyme BshC